MNSELFCNDTKGYEYCVTAKLIATYDLNPFRTSYADKFYLHVFEFEHNGKKYKYRVMYDTVPETITLCFNDLNHIYRLKPAVTNSISDRKFNTILWIFLLIGIVTTLYIIFKISDFLSNYKIKNILILIIFICIFLTFNITLFSKFKKEKKDLKEKLEEAILNNHTAIAYLKRWHSRHDPKGLYHGTELDAHRTQFHGTYKYDYNGKTYTYRGYFSKMPPEKIKLFLGKGPKDILYRGD